MKTLWKVAVSIGLAGGLTNLLEPPRALANLEVNAAVQIRARADFDVPLAAHGTWVEVRSHGRCWRPTGIAVGWRPYCDGAWVWTDCGWYWNSEEPWAWACYHYGRWIYDTELGWVWVPDIEWSPAWVYWRVGGGFIGWAPCPPRGVVVAPAHFSFVAVDHFHERVSPSRVILNDTIIFNQTREITKVTRASRAIGGTRQKVVINEGPGVEVVRKATGRAITAVPIREAQRVPLVPALPNSAPGGPPDAKPTHPLLEPSKMVPPKPMPKDDSPPARQHPSEKSPAKGHGRK